MSNQLSKNTVTSYLPGSPGVPGDPGRAAAPAGFTWVKTTVCGFEPPGPAGIAGIAANSGFSFGYVCTDRLTQSFYPATPAVAPKPSTPATPAQTLTNYNLGWNSGARSIQVLDGNGFLSFTTPSGPVGAVVGFAADDPDGAYLGITHAFYITSTAVRVFESGVERFYVGSRQSGAAYKIARFAGVVTYFVNGVAVYTSAVPSTGTVFMDTSFYAGGDSVADPVIGGTTTAAGVLPALRANGGQGARASADVTLPALAVDARVAQGVFAVFPILLALGSNYSFGGVVVALPSLTTYSEAGLPSPPYALADNALLTVTASGTGLTGEIGGAAVSLPPFSALASKGAYGAAVVMLPALGARGYATEGNENATVGALLMGDISFVAEPVFMAVLNSAGVATTLLAVSVLADAAVASSAAASSVWSFSQIAAAIMQSVITGAALGPRSFQGAAAWVVNLDTNASSTYENFAFSSYAQCGDAYFGAMPDGVYRLGGADDAGGDIDASIDLGSGVLGTTYQKRLTECYLGVASEGQMALRMTVEGATYDYATRGFSPELKMQRVDIGKGIKANYFALELHNSEGCDFELDKVEFRLSELTRRI